ncbi:MAG TPA: TetR/AcrR family transcriptional regulator [Candidatus Aquilonibacter sp.]|jgi:AcrR family transcriptional regulator|nr:TetR/AcrR family transcriptional regulator [Candidatus Aquilonibacter sp.]
MSRTANEKRPEELCNAILQYLSRHGLADLSLRPLAKAVGSSPRVLLYYFGSKEKMVVQVLAEVRKRQRSDFGQIQADTFEQAYRAVWEQLSAPNSLPLFRLFFEAYGIALRHPQIYKDFLRSTVADWVDLIADELRGEGYKKPHARAFATTVLAGLRGFLLDYCATGDRKRVDRAVELWLPTLDAMLRASKEV